MCQRHPKSKFNNGREAGKILRARERETSVWQHVRLEAGASENLSKRAAAPAVGQDSYLPLNAGEAHQHRTPHRQVGVIIKLALRGCWVGACVHRVKYLCAFIYFARQVLVCT